MATGVRWSLDTLAVRAFVVAAALLAAMYLAYEATAGPALVVSVRWHPEATPEDRRAAESTYLLSHALHRGPDNSTYDLLDTSRSNIGALVNDPRVADTHGVDRTTFTPAGDPSEETVTSVLARVPWLRHPGRRADLVLALLLVALPGALIAAARLLRREVSYDRTPRAIVVPTVCAVAAGVWLFRFLTLGNRLLGDDHFGLWAAAAAYHGGVPYVDFFDPGAPLYWTMSLVGQVLSGYRVIGEVAVGSILITIGFALSFALTWRASRSPWIALMMLAISLILLLPTKLYSYPKLFVYPAVLAVLWAYLARPTRRRLFAVAAVYAMALLFRHDHGIFTAPAIVTAVALGAGRGQIRLAAQRCALLAGFVLLILSPWLLWIAATEGLVAYFPARLQQSIGAGLTEPRPSLGLLAERGGALVSIAPPPPVAVTVLWRDGAAAHAAERQYGLTPAGTEANGIARYELHNTSLANVDSLLRDPRAGGVTGIDALTGTPVGEGPMIARWRRQIALLRAQIFPAYVHERNAGPWLFTVYVLLPIIGLGLVAADAYRARPERFPRERTLMTATLVLVLTATLGLMREMGRFCDIAPLSAVAGGWVVSRWIVRPPPFSWTARLGAALALLAVCVTGVAASSFAEPSKYLQGRYVREAVALYRESAANQLSAFLAHPPIEAYAPASSDDDRLLIRYFRDCTEPDDAIWDMNQNFAWPYYAERRNVLHPEWASGFKRTPADQAYALEWIGRHSVPIMFSIDIPPMESLAMYPEVRTFVAERFRDASTPAFRRLFTDERRTGWILVDTTRQPVRMDPVLGLPCFR